MTEQEIVEAYAKLARPIEMRWLRIRNSCIASTWMACEALGRLGVKARPFPVQLIVQNALRARRMSSWHNVNPGPPPIADQLRWKDEGAHEIAIGFGGDPSGYDGHLVVVTDRGLLLDPSIDQVERLGKGIGPFTESLVNWTSRAFLTGKHPLRLGDDTGAVFHYYARPTDTAWQSAKDWVYGKDRYSDAVEAIVATINSPLARTVKTP